MTSPCTPFAFRSLTTRMRPNFSLSRRYDEKAAHEHDVDALQRRLNSLLPQHRRDLPNDFSRLQIALDPKQRREAELTIHRTSPLARYANRSPARTHVW